MMKIIAALLLLAASAHAQISGSFNGGTNAVSVSSGQAISPSSINTPLINGNAQALSVGSSVTVQGSAFSVAGATFVVTGSSVGIQTANPVTALDVNSSAQFGQGATKSTFSITGSLTLDPKAILTTQSASLVTVTSSLTVTGAFAVAGTTLSVSGGSVYVGTATAQSGNPLFEAYTSSMSVYVSSQGAFDVIGGTTPTLSGCGASPTVAAGSNCERGNLTMGAGAASAGCVLAFPSTCFVAAPKCVMNCGGEGALLACGQTANSTIACDTVTSGAATACGTGTFVSWICTGK